MTPEQELELIDIELELRKRKPASSETTIPLPPAPVVEEAPPAPSPEGESHPLGLVDRIATTLKARGWKNLDAEERILLLAASAPRYFGQEILGIGKSAEGMLERSIGPAAGQAIGRASRVPGAERLLGGIGGVAGEAIAEKREGGPIKPGRLASAFISGLVKGRGLSNATAGEVAKEGAKYAGVDAVGTTAEAVIDRGELPSATELAVRAGGAATGAPIAKAFSVASLRENAREPLFQMEDETLRALRKEGVVIPPHEIGMGSDTLASFGGKAALQQEASKRNQFVWQKLARDEIGLGKEALPIRQSELRAKREELGAPYREIQTIHNEAKKQLDERLAALAKEADPHAAQIAMEEPAMKESLSILSKLAAADVDALKQARSQMQKSRQAFFAGDPAAYEPWQAAKAQAEALEDAIDQAGQSLKDDGLLNRLRDSRKRIAQTYNVEEAVNPGNGFVDPVVFGRIILNQGEDSLSGKLKDIGKFQLAFRREAVESSRTPAPGVGNVGSMATTIMASRGDAPGLVGAAANMTIGRAARPYLLSDFVQNNMLNPQERQNFAASLARFIAENAAEDPKVDELMALEERRN